MCNSIALNQNEASLSLSKYVRTSSDHFVLHRNIPALASEPCKIINYFPYKYSQKRTIEQQNVASKLENPSRPSTFLYEHDQFGVCYNRCTKYLDAVVILNLCKCPSVSLSYSAAKILYNSVLKSDLMHSCH